MTSFLTNYAKVPLLSSSEKEDDLLMMTDAAASMDLSEYARRAMEVLGEVMSSVCDIYDENFCDLEEPNEAVAGGELVGSENYLLCGPPYNVRRQNELEDTSHDRFELDDMDDFCDLC